MPSDGLKLNIISAEVHMSPTLQFLVWSLLILLTVAESGSRSLMADSSFTHKLLLVLAFCVHLLIISVSQSIALYLHR